MSKKQSQADCSEPKAAGRGVQLLNIHADQAGQRVDNFLLARLKGVPKSRIYRILRKGEVRVNKRRVKPEYKLCAGDCVRVPPVVVAEREPAPQAGQSLRRYLEGAVLFETDALLIVNKPSGLAVHGGSGVSLGLIEALRQIRADAHFLELIHRLDRDTSGCVMIAKKRSMLRYMQKLLREKSLGGQGSGVEKYYMALVEGSWPKRKSKVDVPLRKSSQIAGEAMVRPDRLGKPSLTRYRLLQYYQSAGEMLSLIEAQPVTGRTHQIRVHCQYAGHSLAGDSKYSSAEFNRKVAELGFRRLFLHACKLRFKLPDSDRIIEVEAPLPPELSEPLSRLVEVK